MERTVLPLLRRSVVLALPLALAFPLLAAARSSPPCQDVIENARLHIQKLRNAADEQDQLERIDCGKDLDCHARAREKRAVRAKEIQKEQIHRTRQIRDCEAEARVRGRDAIRDADEDVSRVGTLPPSGSFPESVGEGPLGPPPSDGTDEGPPSADSGPVGTDPGDDVRGEPGKLP